MVLTFLLFPLSPYRPHQKDQYQVNNHPSSANLESLIHPAKHCNFATINNTHNLNQHQAKKKFLITALPPQQSYPATSIPPKNSSPLLLSLSLLSYRERHPPASRASVNKKLELQRLLCVSPSPSPQFQVSRGQHTLYPISARE